jgi:hypothetical protein
MPNFNGRPLLCAKRPCVAKLTMSAPGGKADFAVMSADFRN